MVLNTSVSFHVTQEVRIGYDCPFLKEKNAATFGGLISQDPGRQDLSASLRWPVLQVRERWTGTQVRSPNTVPTTSTVPTMVLDRHPL